MPAFARWHTRGRRAIRDGETGGRDNASGFQVGAAARGARRLSRAAAFGRCRAARPGGCGQLRRAHGGAEMNASAASAGPREAMPRRSPGATATVRDGALSLLIMR
jgi:hypothetical protein